MFEDVPIERVMGVVNGNPMGTRSAINTQPFKERTNCINGPNGTTFNKNNSFENIEDSENRRIENIGTEQKKTPRKGSRRSVRGGRLGGRLGRSPHKSPNRRQDAANVQQRRFSRSPTEWGAKKKVELDVNPPLILQKVVPKSPDSVAETFPALSPQSAPSLDDTGDEQVKSVVSWRTSAIKLLVEGVILFAAILFICPSYDAPTTTSKSFFHTVEQGESFSFELDVQAWPSPSYQWRLNGVDLAGMTTNRLFVEKARVEDSGTYTCLVENMAGRLVWEEGYVNVIKETKTDPSLPDRKFSSSGDSEKVRQARMCLLTRAPEAVLPSASIDGGAAVIAAGESAGYLDCFTGLQKMLNNAKHNPSVYNKKIQALDLLRSLHGSSNQRSLLVNSVSALDEVVTAKQNSNKHSQAHLDDLSGRVAFVSGLYCASSPQCVGDRVVTLIMKALIGPSD
eukprot:CAMPEP_0203752894 /NCGR_PEP_ID=MMETSP0098-20131031/6754_1 /ASSEMBLY_ACC=CAM_ASM_000208 /TAXON_ID=96639 /ORGANISM=" , Strain NY0313808BC1" /LENGTH=452 /DNA_ID=CAMNT_0050643265 /DNA_START=491 /DNA_END=1847 /DNA_ORIENTATION=-